MIQHFFVGEDEADRDDSEHPPPPTGRPLKPQASLIAT